VTPPPCNICSLRGADSAILGCLPSRFERCCILHILVTWFRVWLLLWPPYFAWPRFQVHRMLCCPGSLAAVTHHGQQLSCCSCCSSSATSDLQHVLNTFNCKGWALLVCIAVDACPLPAGMQFAASCCAYISMAAQDLGDLCCNNCFAANMTPMHGVC
jgi:hypothetical protein